MAFSMASITGLFKRSKKARDPFGDDEDFDEDFIDEDSFDDEDSEGRGLGPKIALGVSVGLSLLLVTFIGTVILTADETAGPVAGSMPTEITQVVDENGNVIQDLTANQGETSAEAATGAEGAATSGPIALPPIGDTSATVIDDTTAESDRSADRRPWLTGDTTATSEGGRASSMDDLLRQSRESQPPPSAPTTAPVPAPLGGIAMPAPVTPNAAATATMATALPQAGESAEGVAPEPDASAEMETAALPPAPTELVPGAAGRFASTDALQQQPREPGAGPRLVEPETPPTDSRVISAAPPRFATLPAAQAIVQDDTARARVAIIVEGLGLNQAATEAAIDSLPPSVTLAFSPYARDLPDWLERAREAGHEVLIEVPMESKRFPADDPGPFGLLTSLDALQNVERLTAILATAEGAPGILDTTGSRFRESSEHISLVMNNLDARGMFYVQGRPGLRVGTDKVPTATADIVIDERDFRASIDARLDYIEELARYQGSSVAIASPKPATYERIALWLDDVTRRGVAVAPVSQVLIQ